MNKSHFIFQLTFIRFVASVCFVLFVLFSNAQQYSFIQYSLKEGLAQSQVRCLYQDKNGFIWAGTLGGVSQFDGREFTNWDVQDGLLANQVSSFCEMPDGRMAVGTIGGISWITRTGIKSLPFRTGWSETTVNALSLDKDNRLWIGTENGLCYFENDSIHYFEKENPLASAHIKSFYTDRSGRLLITTKEKVLIWKGNSAELFYVPEDSETNFFDLVQTASGQFWLATKGQGLVRLDENGKNPVSYGFESGLSTSTITGLLTDENDQLWITSRFGYFRYDGKTLTSFSEKNGLKTPDIRDILEDNEGNLWLASYGSGILKFTGEAFSFYNKDDGLSSDAIMSITQDTSGHIWFSTFDQGICKLVGDTIESYDLKDITGNSRIWSSINDQNANQWFGSSDGLFLFSKGKFSQFTEDDSLPDRTVLCLFEDSKKRLLVGTAKGFAMFNGKSFVPLPGENLPATRVRDIDEDRTSRIWLATREGVYRYDGNGFDHYGEKEGILGNTSYCVEIDPQNRIWVGTQNGIALFNGEKFETISVGSSSGSNTINFLKYHAGKLWIGTNDGLYFFEDQPSTSISEIKFGHCGLDDGLRSLETNLNAVFVDRDQRFWFGTPEGVMVMDADELNKRHESIAPKISITKVQLNLQDQDWSKLKAKVDEVTGLPVDLSVKYKNNHFTFYFTGISLTYPEEVRYQYMLEGFDEDWKSLTNANFATYSNLPYDRFTFRVRAKSKHGATSDEATFSFEILPPFWLTWWFILLEALAITAIVSAIFYYRKKIITARHEKEKSEMRSKMLALEQQSLNSSMNRHFIFNALNSIQYYINRQDRLAANRYLSDFAKLIRKNLDSSTENLTTLREEVERLELYLKLEHMRFKDKFEYHIHVDESLDQDNIKVPAMLLQPFLENSIWHGLLPMNAPGKVEVDISLVNGSIEFTITDNGIGIENSLKNKSGLDNHISKGMQITNGRIELIKKMTTQSIELQGPYQLHDAQDRPSGTQVRIKLPVNFHELFSN